MQQQVYAGRVLRVEQTIRMSREEANKGALCEEQRGELLLLLWLHVRDYNTVARGKGARKEAANRADSGSSW